jgi:nucleotide-binding universal stress UspA family protein
MPPEAGFRGKLNVVVEFGNAAKGILRVSEEQLADLIVMGAHSGNIFSDCLPRGTVPPVLRLARCPVLTVREGK